MIIDELVLDLKAHGITVDINKKIDKKTNSKQKTTMGKWKNKNSKKDKNK